MKAISLEEFNAFKLNDHCYAEDGTLLAHKSMVHQEWDARIAEALAQREQLLAACTLARDKGRYDEMLHFATICAAICRAES